MLFNRGSKREFTKYIHRLFALFCCYVSLKYKVPKCLRLVSILSSLDKVLVCAFWNTHNTSRYKTAANVSVVRHRQQTQTSFSSTSSASPSLLRSLGLSEKSLSSLSDMARCHQTGQKSKTKTRQNESIRLFLLGTAKLC